jgi:hypothetical protein
MKKWMLLPALLIVPVNSFSVDKITEPKLKEFFAESIRSKGYSCNSCKDIYLIDEDSRGFVYRVICSNNVLSFTVIIAPTGEVLVEPW